MAVGWEIHIPPRLHPALEKNLLPNGNGDGRTGMEIETQSLSGDGGEFYSVLVLTSLLREISPHLLVPSWGKNLIPIPVYKKYI